MIPYIVCYKLCNQICEYTVHARFIKGHKRFATSFVFRGTSKNLALCLRPVCCRSCRSSHI